MLFLAEFSCDTDMHSYATLKRKQGVPCSTFFYEIIDGLTKAYKI